MKDQQNVYEWEDDARAEVDAGCGKYDVIGVAVVNQETGEACFLDFSDVYSGVERADYLKDVRYDVDHAYAKSVSNMFEGE